MNVIVKTAIAVFLCITMLVCVPAHAGGKKKMEPLYDLKLSASIEPTVYQVEKDIYTLFPVMRGNAIHAGTVSLNHAITVLSFSKSKLIREEFFHDVFDDLQLDSTVKVIPAIAPDILGLGYTRSFILFDLKKKIHREYFICKALEQTIEKIAIADAHSRQFIFEIEKYPKKSAGTGWDYTNVLLLMNLKGDEPNLIKEIIKDRGVTWTTSDNNVFLNYFDECRLQALDNNLEPTNHPLVDVIKRNKGKIEYTWIQPHSYLPFVILSGGKEGSAFLSWGEGREKQPQTLFSSAKEFSFSKDGKWIVFRKKDFIAGKELTYLMPVSEKYPYYLGTPILLWKNRFQSDQIVWTTNPLSFVGAYGDSIYRWELTKEAQRSMMGNDFDRYPTFHDWIVAKDLEKLTKEKKQGLGK